MGSSKRARACAQRPLHIHTHARASCLCAECACTRASALVIHATRTKLCTTLHALQHTVYSVCGLNVCLLTCVHVCLCVCSVCLLGRAGWRILAARKCVALWLRLWYGVWDTCHFEWELVCYTKTLDFAIHFWSCSRSHPSVKRLCHWPFINCIQRLLEAFFCTAIISMADYTLNKTLPCFCIPCCTKTCHIL